MIDKKELLQKIHKVIEYKDILAPLLDRHISASLTFSGLDQATVHAMREKFQDWALLQLKHVEVLKAITKELHERKSDVL
jgi:hypothetical protein